MEGRTDRQTDGQTDRYRVGKRATEGMSRRTRDRGTERDGEPERVTQMVGGFERHV